MWIQSSQSRSTPHGHVVDFELQQPQRKLHLTIYHQQPIQQLETDTAILLVWGRVRQYGMDYPTQPDLGWLLALLEQQDANFYAQLAGFFSLLLLNKRDGSLLLLNDHAATSPLFYSRELDAAYVAAGAANAAASNTVANSPADSVRDAPNETPVQQVWISDHLKHPAATSQPLSSQAIFDYFFFHCIPAENCIYQHSAKLAPATAYRRDAAGSIQRQSLYQPQYVNQQTTTLQNSAQLATQQNTALASQLQQQCRDTINTAVRRNISPASGAFLSGGLDSSTVSGYFCLHQPNAKTFSIGFDAKGYDETEYALITAKHFASSHQVHYLQPQEIVENFVEVASYFDEPFGNSSAMAAFICSKVAKADGVQVMLAGDGGDEIFAGNERYAKQKVFERYQQVPALLRDGLESLLATPLAKLPFFSKAKSYVDQANVPLPDRLDSYNFLNRFVLTEMFCPEFLAKVDPSAPAEAKRQRYHACPTQDPVEKMMFLDWKFTLADNDFVKVTRMCHKAGVEVRYPLFEKEVVDFSCQVPTELKLPGNALRDFYKQSFRGFLPDATLAKSKHGFGLPFGVWMKEQPKLQQLTAQSLTALKQRGILQPSFIDQALATYQSGHSGYYGELIWIMVILELWLSQREVAA